MLYYGSRISDNMTRTPEGYLICMNVPINRTGSQEYLGSELQLDSRDGNQRIEVLRDADQVFDRATLASFEGKPVCNEHPTEDVDITNNDMYQVGHCQNVRQEGDYTVADLYITNPEMIQEIENGKREISCGYTCDFIPGDNGTYKQTNIRGNHIAVVNSGRAGENVSIKDSKQDVNNSEFSNEEDLFKQLNRKVENYNGGSSEFAQLLDELYNAKFNGKLDDRKAAQLINMLKGRFENMSIKDSKVEDSKASELKSKIDNTKSLRELERLKEEVNIAFNADKAFDAYTHNDLLKRIKMAAIGVDDSKVNDSIYSNYIANIKSAKSRSEFEKLDKFIEEDYNSGKLSKSERDRLIGTLYSYMSVRGRDSSIKDEQLLNELENRFGNIESEVKTMEQNNVNDSNVKDDKNDYFSEIALDIKNGDYKHWMSYRNGGKNGMKEHIKKNWAKELTGQEINQLIQMVDRYVKDSNYASQLKGILDTKYVDELKQAIKDDENKNKMHLIETVKKNGESSSRWAPNKAKSWDQIEEERRDKKQEDN